MEHEEIKMLAEQIIHKAEVYAEPYDPMYRKAARRGFIDGYVYGMQRELKEQIMSMIKPW